jgi:carbonic anhydrase/acetyltransferase-like protein (isoleucine patch superfamily)
MPIYALGDDVPEVHPSAWVAPGAVLIGKVKVDAGATIWFGAVLRGDNEPIVIGEGTSIQENCVLHTDPDCPLTVGPGCTIGHLAMLHGCTIGRGTLVGMAATVLNRTVVGEGCLIGAMALIPEDRTIPDASLVMGAPGKVVKDVTDAQRARMAEGALRYVERGELFRRSLREVG